MLRDLNQGAGGRRVCDIPYVGVLADDIPTGFDHPSLLENDIDGGDPAGCRYRTQILTGPSAGVLVVSSDGSYIFTPPTEEFSGTVTGTQLVSKFDSTHRISANETAYNFVYGDVAQVSSDLVANYAIAVRVSADLVGSYQIESSVTEVSSELVASYSIATAVYSDLPAVYGIASTVSVDLMASYQVLSDVTFTRAPVGAGYTPRRAEQQYRPAAIQRNNR